MSPLKRVRKSERNKTKMGWNYFTCIEKETNKLNQADF